jgi:hypothetical protein
MDRKDGVYDYAHDAEVVENLKAFCNVFTAFPTDSKVAKEVITVAEIDAYIGALNAKHESLNLFPRLQTELEALRIDARRWQAVRDGSYELLHNLSTAPAQYREQIIDEVIKL